MAYLHVRKASEQDKTSLSVSIRGVHKPSNIKWGNWVHISVKNEHNNTEKITCKVRGSQAGLDDILINRNLRTRLGIRINRPYEFRIEKASSLLMLLYIMRYHPNDIKRAQAKAIVVTIIIAIGAAVIGLLIIIAFAAIPVSI